MYLVYMCLFYLCKFGVDVCLFISRKSNSVASKFIDASAKFLAKVSPNKD